MMFENYHLQCLKILIFPFHGILLDPLIEDFCGPLINCDSCSTFDGTSPFLASPSSGILRVGYQLTISTHLQIPSGRVEAFIFLLF